MAAGIRRRRRCSKYTCAGRVTTIEAVTRVTRGAAIGHIVQVPRRQLEQLRRLVTAIGGGDP
jgi:transcriptional regulator NrdR family protein